MGMSPVRRAFVILLCRRRCRRRRPDVRAGPGRHAASVPPTASRIRTHPNYSPPWSARSRRAATTYDVLTNGDQIFPRDARGDRRRAAAGSVSKPTSTTPARSPTSSRRRSSARRGAACTCSWWSMRSAPARWRRSTSSGWSARVPHRRSSIARAGTRSKKLNYRTHRKILVVDGEVGVHRRRRHRRSLAGQRAGQGALARHARPHPRAVARLHGRRHSTRTASRPTAPSHPVLDDPTPAPRTTRAPSIVVRSSPTGGSNELKRLYLLAIARRAEHDRHHARRTSSPTNRPTWALRGRRQARREDPHPGRRGHHRRDAGEVRVAPGLRARCSRSASRSTSTSRR